METIIKYCIRICHVLIFIGLVYFGYQTITNIGIILLYLAFIKIRINILYLCRSTYYRKNILITGCDSGFGYDMARKLSLSHVVFATCLRDESITEHHKWAKENQLEKNLHAIKMDVCNEDDINNVEQEIGIYCNHLDIIICNAGVYHKGFRVSDTKLNSYHHTILVNYLGAVAVVKKFETWLDNSKIIFISSCMGRNSIFGCSAYSASKMALEGFADSLRQEWKDRNSVYIIEPGCHNTGLIDEVIDSFKFITKSIKIKIKNDYLKLICGKPEAITSVIETILYCPTFILPSRFVVGLDAFIWCYIFPGCLPDFIVDFIVGIGKSILI